MKKGMFLCLVFIFEIFESHTRRVLLRLALTVSRSLAEYIAVQAHLHCENAVVRRTVLADENIFENFLRRLLNNTLQL